MLAKMLLAVCFACVCVLLTGCGGGGGSDSPAPAPAPAPSADPAFAKIQPLIAANCGPCHNGTTEPAFPDAATFKASQAKAKLEAGAMPPPPRTISDADKAALLGYLGG